MTLAYLGGKSFGQLMPLAVQAQAQLTASIGVPLADLQARLAGALALPAFIALQPPSIAGTLQSALQLVATLQAQIALGVPDVPIDLSGILLVVAELQAQVAALEGALSFAASLSAVFSAGGIHAYAFSGATGELVAGGVPGGGGPSEQGFGLLLLTTSPSTWATMETAFGL